MTSLELAKKAAAFLDEKKAVKLNLIKIEDISALADYFIIATGTSTTHVRALTEELEEKLKEDGFDPRIEGHRGGSWTLMDYGSVVVHVFTQEAREFYDLDRLWADGEKVDWQEN